METPLYTALRAFAGEDPMRFHMPGHHGRPMPMAELSGYERLDFTELPPTGDLFSPGGPIEAAENLWAAAFHQSCCLFLTGGSTQGVHTALTLACPIGSKILMDRGCHRSAFHAMALLDLRPTYLPRPWLAKPGVTGPIDPQTVENLLAADPEIKTVCITSPTYYGVLSDIPAISAIVHAHGGKLVVDGAHGAHLPFLLDDPYRGADLVVASAHKTLPAPGQAALLFSGPEYPMDELRRAGQIYGSSSPSYPIMAALDLCRAYMEGEGTEAYRETARTVAALRAEFPSLRDTDAPLDPIRFVWRVPDGFAAQRRLEAQNVYPEMADAAHVVFLLSPGDGALAPYLEEGEAAEGPPAPRPPSAFPQQVMTPRQALFSPKKYLPLRDAQGYTAAEQVAPYPPGIPVIAPGERVDKKHLSYLAEVGYNIENKIGVL